MINDNSMRYQASCRPYCFPEIQTGLQAENEIRSDYFKRTFAETSPNAGMSGFEPIHPQIFKESGQRIESSRNGISSNSSDPHSEAMNKLIEKAQKNEAAAYEKGLQEGIRKGIARGEKTGYDRGVQDGCRKIESMIHLFNLAIEDMEDFKKQLYVRAQEEAVKLSLALARKIICTEPGMCPDILVNVMQEALKKSDAAEIVRIRIHPSEFEYIHQKRSDLKISDSVVLVEDGTIEPGGCMIETHSGDVDARLQSQIQVLEEAFEQELAKFRACKMRNG